MKSIKNLESQYDSQKYLSKLLDVSKIKDRSSYNTEVLRFNKEFIEQYFSLDDFDDTTAKDCEQISHKCNCDMASAMQALVDNGLSVKKAISSLRLQSPETSEKTEQEKMKDLELRIRNFCSGNVAGSQMKVLMEEAYKTMTKNGFDEEATFINISKKMPDSRTTSEDENPFKNIDF